MSQVPYRLRYAARLRSVEKSWYEAEGPNEYSEAYKRIQKALKKAMWDWRDIQCEEVERVGTKTTEREHITMIHRHKEIWK